MNFSDVKELIQIMNNSPIASMDISMDNVHIKLEKESTGIISERAPLPASPVIEEANPLTIQPEEKTPEGNVVKSPIVGTFYTSQSPDMPPIVKVGDSVKKGDLLCIVEAMKVMNEIVSEWDGTIAEIYPENEDMVAFAQPLFRIV